MAHLAVDTDHVDNAAEVHEVDLNERPHSIDEIRELLKHSDEVIEASKKRRRSKELLEDLPQGPGSSLDADTVDGLHAQEIIEQAQEKRPRISRGGAGRVPSLENYVRSEPPGGMNKIVNIYVELVAGKPCLHVVYRA